MPAATRACLLLLGSLPRLEKLALRLLRKLAVGYTFAPAWRVWLVDLLLGKTGYLEYWEYSTAALAFYPLACKPYALVHDTARTIAFDSRTREAHILLLRGASQRLPGGND